MKMMKSQSVNNINTNTTENAMAKSDTNSQAQGRVIKPLVMNDVDAAKFIGLKPSTLRKWRCLGIGPVYISVGRLVKCRLTDLEAYIEKSAVAR